MITLLMVQVGEEREIENWKVNVIYNSIAIAVYEFWY